MHTADQPAPTPRTLETALECAVETARTSARNDNGTWFLKVHGTALLNALRELSAKTAEAERLREALEKVERWQFPPTGKFWESGTPVSYGAAYGSNGERDYMRNVARAALAATRKEEGNG